MKEDLKNLNEVELKILAARKTGKSLCDLTSEEYEVALTGIIFNISAIVGCQLPTHPAHVNALEKEFSIFLKDFGYSGLTYEEVLTAFRMNANFKFTEHAELYGAIFNIEYAAKVLKQYVGKRGNIDWKVSDYFYDRDVKAELKIDEDKRRKKIKEQYEIFLANENSELDLSDCYMQLAHDDAFYTNRYNENFYPQLQKQEEEEKQEGGEQSIGSHLLGLEKKLNKNFESGKLAVKFLFEQIKKLSIKEIYNDKLEIQITKFKMPEPERPQDDF